ncbi:MAG: cupin domain-containing protein [Deltaproteobacteria bacterium]|nr:cupin domain-containing protein [Deltaproteobacteria bacterium]
MAAVEFIDLSEEISEDPRGLSFFPFKNRVSRPDVIIPNFHLVSIQPGQVRGNHVHPGHLEWLYPFHGEGDFIWKTTNGGQASRRIAGHRVLIRIPPGIAHAVRNVGAQPIYLLAWREPLGEAQGQPETVPCPVVETP